MAGRPKGIAKTGGRKRGTPNKATASIKDAAREHTADAMRVLVAVMKDERQPAAARVAAVKEIFDRGFGKATQHTELTGKDGGPVRMSKPADLSDDELAAIAAGQA